MAQGVRRWLILAGVAAVVVAAGVLMFAKRGPAVKLLTAEVSQGPLDATVSATGTVNPDTLVHVGSQVSGTVSALYADYNTRVHFGQLLLKLDPAIYRAQLGQAEANLEKAKVDVANALRNFTRAKEMFAKKYIAQTDLDAAQTAYDGSVAAEKQTQAALDLARVNLDHCTITSPLSGTVISRSVDIGQTVAASLQAPEMFQIAADLTRMQVQTAIDEADIGKIAVGQPVTFTVDAFPDLQFHGTVSLIWDQPITVQNVVTYTTIIEVPNPEMKLRPGMTANVTIQVAHRDNVIKVPNAALRYRPSADVAKAYGLKLDDGKRWGGAGGGSDSSRNGGAGRDSSHAGGMRGDVAQAAEPGQAGGRDSSAQGGRWKRGGNNAGGQAGAGGAGGAGHGQWRRGGGQGGGQWAGAGSGQSGANGGQGRGQWAGGQGGSSHGGFGSTGVSASLKRQPPAKVYVQIAPGKLEAVTVKAGLSDGAFTEIVSGDLQPGQTVITGALAQGGGSQQTPPGFGGPGGPGGRR